MVTQKDIEEELPVKPEPTPELYELVSRLYPRYPDLKPEDFTSEMERLVTWAGEDPEGFLYDLEQRGSLEEQDVILRAIGVPEEYFVAKAEVGVEEERVKGLITDVFPDLTPDELVTFATEDWDLFILQIQTKGRTKETQDLLRVMGFEWEDIGQIFETERVMMEVEGVRKLVSIETDLRGTNLVKDTQGRVIGELDSMGEVTPYKYRIGDTWASFSAGTGDVIATAGAALKWMGADGIGENLSEFGKFLQLQAPPDTLGEFEWSHLYNPRFYAIRVVRTLPFSLSLVPAMIAGSYAGLGVAALVGAGKLGTFILRVLGATALSRPLESALEAGGTYDEALAKGLTEAEATEAANQVFKNNLVLAGADFAQLAIAFMPSPFKSLGQLTRTGLFKTAMVGGRLTLVGLSEAGEEYYQEIIQRIALGEDIVWDAEMKEVMSIGGIMGVGMGSAGAVWTNIMNISKDNLTPELKSQWDEGVVKAYAEGLTGEQAELKAWDAIIDDKDAQKAMKNAIEQAKVDEWEKEIKPKTEADKVVWEHTFDQMREEITPIPEVVPEVPPVTPEVTPPVTEVVEAPPTKPPVKPPAPPVAEIVPAPPIEEKSQDKLIRLVKEAKPAREETEILKHEELARKAAEAAGILETGEGRAAFERSKGALKGELPKADFEAPETQLSEENVKELYNFVRDSELRYFEKLNTAEALGKVLSGEIPTRGEIILLENIFGSELAKTLLDKRTLSAKAWELFLDAINLPRAVLASWDLSAPLRQGALLFWGQPKESLSALKPMVQTFASEKTTILVAETLAEGKYAALRERAGLYQAPLFGVSATLTQREEAFMSRLAKYIPLVRRSERAYVTYLNKVRADVFDSYAAHWEGTGKTLKDYKKLAEAINIMTGRGSLGKLSNLAPMLSGVFFSPRYQASRIQLPITFLTATPVVRKMMARNIVAFVAANFAMLALIKLAGGDTEDDPRSSDFGKGKIGNTRLDFWAGFQQYSRAVVQLMTGMRKVSTTGKLSEVERGEILGRFVRGKFSPVLGLVADILSGESFIGEPLSLEPKDVQIQAFNRLVPMFIQDLVEAIDDMGILGALLAMPGMFGVGVQTYGGGYWDEFLDQLGEPIPSDTLPYTVDKEKIYTTKNFYSDALNRTRGMTLEDIDPKYGFPPLAKTVVETANLKKVYEERPHIALYKIEEFELYHAQWLEYTKAKTDEERDVVKEKYPDYHMGNFSQRELSLLKKYHKAKDKDAFLEEHPGLKLKPRIEWLKANPMENARLAVFGQAKIYTLEAYNEFQRLIKELDIPDDAIPEFTLPPEESMKTHFAYEDFVTDGKHASWEAQLLLAKDPDYAEWRELTISDSPIPALELKVKHRVLFDEYNAYGDKGSPLYVEDGDARNKARDLLKAYNTDWVDDIRRIEAYENDGANFAKAWVDRGKTIDEFGAGSSEAKVWLIDNPETHNWALEQGLLTDDGSDWNVPALRINAKWSKEDEEYLGFGDEEAPNYVEDDTGRQEARDKHLATHEDYRKDRRRREAYRDEFSENQVENFVNYYELPITGYRQERFLIDNPSFAEEMHNIRGIDLPKPQDVPAVQYDEIYEKWQADFDKLEGLSNHESPYYIEDPDAREKTRESMRFKAGKLTDFGKAEIRREAYGKLVPDKHIESYVGYYSIIAEGKPEDLKRKTGTDLWYEDDWWMMEHPDFYKEIYLGILKNERKDYRLVPTREVFKKYQKYLDLPLGKRRDDYRFDNLDLDDWLVLKFGYVPITDKKRREELTPAERLREDIAREEKEIEEALEEAEEKLKKLGGEEEELGEPSPISIQRLVSTYGFTQQRATQALATLNKVDFTYNGQKIDTEEKLFTLLDKLSQTLTPYEIVWELEKAAWGSIVPYPIPKSERGNFREWDFTEETEVRIAELVDKYGFKDNEAINALNFAYYKGFTYQGKVIDTEAKLMVLIRELAKQGLVAHEIVWRLEEIAYGYKIER